jgi:hypothetical protein
LRLATLAQATHTEGAATVALSVVIALLVLKLTPAGRALFSAPLAVLCAWWDRRAPASRTSADAGGGVDWLGRSGQWGRLERFLTWLVRA